MIGVPESPNQAYAFGLKMLGENYELKDKINQLNRELSSWKAGNAKLEERIKQMRSEGNIDLQHEIETLEGILNSRFPESRISNQRKEIAQLHKIIGRLKDEIKGLGGE